MVIRAIPNILIRTKNYSDFAHFLKKNRLEYCIFFKKNEHLEVRVQQSDKISALPFMQKELANPYPVPENTLKENYKVSGKKWSRQHADEIPVFPENAKSPIKPWFSRH